MKKFLQVRVKIGNQTFCSQCPVSTLDFDISDEDSINQYAIDLFNDDETLSTLGCDDDDQITFVDYQILDQDSPELMLS